MCQENQHIIAGFQKVTSEVERAIMSTNLLSACRINPTLHQLHFHFSKSQKLKVNCQFREVMLKATRAHSYIFFHWNYIFFKNLMQPWEMIAAHQTERLWKHCTDLQHSFFLIKANTHTHTHTHIAGKKYSIIRWQGFIHVFLICVFDD